jgi:ATP-dependent Zn protease
VPPISHSPECAIVLTILTPALYFGCNGSRYGSLFQGQDRLALRRMRRAALPPMKQTKKAKQTKYTEKMLVTTAHHEAGHGLILHWHRIHVKEISIIPKERKLGYCRCAPLWYHDAPSSPIKKCHMQEWMIGFLGGLEAERRFAPTSVGTYHSSSDYERAADLARSLSHDSDEEVDARLKLAHIQARNLVNSLWPGIQLLAEELVARKVIKGATLQRLLADAITAALEGDNPRRR